MKVGTVILAGGLNKAVIREVPPDGGERRTSPLEAAFSNANAPWPAYGGRKCPDYLDFLVVDDRKPSGFLYAMVLSMLLWGLSG